MGTMYPVWDDSFYEKSSTVPHFAASCNAGCSINEAIDELNDCRVVIIIESMDATFVLTYVLEDRTEYDVLFK